MVPQRAPLGNARPVLSRGTLTSLLLEGPAQGGQGTMWLEKEH